MDMNIFVSLFRCSLPIAFLQSVALADEMPIVPATEQGTTIVGTLPDGRPSPPVSKPGPPNFSIKNSVIRKIDVVEAPEFPELPMVKGRINATVQLVDDPNLPDPPPPLPGLDISDPAVQARMAEMRSKYKDRTAQFVFVSGTVYNHSRTFLRLHLNGDPKNVISGWSNLDLNYFSGFANYQIKNQDGEIFRYSLLLSISNTDTQKENLRLNRLGKVYQAPQIPSVGELAAVGPSFVVTDGNTADAKAMHAFQGLHDLYRVEGPRMETAYHARIKAAEERKAYLLAHPPVPADVSIQFWKRNPAGSPQPENQEAR